MYNLPKPCAVLDLTSGEVVRFDSKKAAYRAVRTVCGYPSDGSYALPSGIRRALYEGTFDELPNLKLFDDVLAAEITAQIILKESANDS